MTRKELSFEAAPDKGTVSAISIRPDGAKCQYVFAHGAGAGMHHAIMETMCERLADQAIATFRYQYPYMEHGKKRPDHRNLLIQVVRNAVNCASELHPDLPLYAGGKSMGGRMTSMAAAEEPLPGVRGLIFFGFPLHPAGKPGTERADHLFQVNVPMLFLQGTRDTLAGLDLLTPICERLGEKALLHICEGGDHSFKVLKRSGRTEDEVHLELANAVASFTNG